MAKERLVLGGRFKLIRHLGGGGMSEVFLAEQLSLGRAVALKVLKRDLGAQPGMAERFRREALLLSTVDHPAVVRVIDYESAPEGTVLVLEYAEGETLEHAARMGPFEPRRGVRVLTQLAEGLAAIHAAGIIHRDLKPQNVVLTPGPRGEQARLLDFGIARLLEIPEDTPTGPPSPHGDPFVSHPGQAVGTPAYVAPEQATAAEVDTRTDVYTFGVMAYRMLAGRLPFEGPSTEEFLRQHVKDPPPPLDETAPHLSDWPELKKLVMQCLEKKPANRPADARELTEALHRLVPVDLALTTQTRKALGAFTTQTWKTMSSSAGTVGAAGLTGAKHAAGLWASLTREWKRSILITAALVAALPVTWALWPPPVHERVARYVAEGKLGDALELLDVALPDASGDLPRLLALKAATLHKLGRTDSERSLLRAAPHQALFLAEPLLLDALCEDFAGAEGDAELKEWLSLPQESWATPTLVQFAKGPLSKRQWGALRFLDGAGRTTDLNLVVRYSASLRSKDCAVRATSARRLAELGDTDAIGPLRELSETPKDESGETVTNCGQDEAAEAIRQLRKKPS